MGTSLELTELIYGRQSAIDFLFQLIIVVYVVAVLVKVKCLDVLTFNETWKVQFYLCCVQNLYYEPYVCMYYQ